ncbi:hypothetical protein UC34_10070 [Pandoraea vervacti]|uniref:EamA domain-containing protein n=1 Tax=Pandoraea vervacti TaxID=656178 RepID=A0ABM5SXI9_9BURK|nr:hypothetical protein [Pandoraea vervacti]AJP57258.1 hypothetical protein UC34_10070 [Pandoraea vervacti]
MKSLLLVIPVALLVAYSQIMIKFRAAGVVAGDTLTSKLAVMLRDPLIVSAYGAAFLASIAWMVIVTRLPLAVAFPIYIGVTFVMVIIGAHWFLGEQISLATVTAASLILAGITIGVTAGQ